MAGSIDGDQEEPLVSVIMPVYNAAATISHAVESVRRQGFTQWELIIVDDGSTDDTALLCQSFAAADERIRFVTLETNTGSPARPRNVGLDQVRGEWCAFLDADDTWRPEKLGHQLRFMQEQGLDLCGTSVSLMNAKGAETGRRLFPGSLSYSSLLRHNTLVCSTVLCRSTHLADRRFPEIGHEDYALWLDLARSGGKLGVLPEVLASYRKHQGSVSANKRKVVGYFWNIYHHYLGYSVLVSAFFTCRYLFLAAMRATRE
ncbi:glycosyltransferase family 2 protein [Gilvimarinus algae]|uniref:Glycosyltransferase n=1 Tax=Gilvimarinus algae TaxID=3058037 RepID=A0ABT8THK7_9GAMM|nr:glycosyltransferase family 2 protein [Gilvimarinus sp. SDUM040014]MDO3383584.1 glycosyltransferase [Gilvimarinus sp. SDUM040014]